MPIPPREIEKRIEQMEETSVTRDKISQETKDELKKAHESSNIKHQVELLYEILTGEKL